MVSATEIGGVEVALSYQLTYWAYEITLMLFAPRTFSGDRKVCCWQQTEGRPILHCYCTGRKSCSGPQVLGKHYVIVLSRYHSDSGFYSMFHVLHLTWSQELSSDVSWRCIEATVARIPMSFWASFDWELRGVRLHGAMGDRLLWGWACYEERYTEHI